MSETLGTDDSNNPTVNVTLFRITAVRLVKEWRILGKTYSKSNKQIPEKSYNVYERTKIAL